MENITIGQLMQVVAIISAFVAFYKMVMTSIDNAFQKQLKPLSEDIEMLKEVTYQMLDHLATDNNSGGMKQALDKYVKYSIKN